MTREELSYLGNYYIRSTRPLRTELAIRIPGLGFRNVDRFLSKSLGSKLRSTRFVDLTPQEVNVLEEIVVNGALEVERFYANKKSRTLSDNYTLETMTESDKNYVLVGNKFHSEAQLDRKRLIKTNCYVGVRLKEFKKVHGQRTRTTGRKNKILKGFQKNKVKVSLKSSKDKQKTKSSYETK